MPRANGIRELLPRLHVAFCMKILFYNFQARGCAPMQPFHAIVNPSQGGALHVPIPPGHVIVHIPPVVRPTVPPAVVVPTEGELASFIFLPIASLSPFYESCSAF